MPQNTLMQQDNPTVQQPGEEAQDPKIPTQMISARVPVDLWEWVLMGGLGTRPKTPAQEILRQALVEFRERVESGKSRIGA
jgi:hypothetical protein